MDKKSNWKDRDKKSNWKVPIEQENDSENYKSMAMNLFVTLSNVLIQWLTYYVLKNGTKVKNLYTITLGYIINKHPERLGENQRFKVLLTLDVVLQWSRNNLYNIGIKSPIQVVYSKKKKKPKL